MEIKLVNSLTVIFFFYFKYKSLSLQVIIRLWAHVPGRMPVTGVATTLSSSVFAVSLFLRVSLWAFNIPSHNFVHTVFFLRTHTKNNWATEKPGNWRDVPTIPSLPSYAYEIVRFDRSEKPRKKLFCFRFLYENNMKICLIEKIWKFISFIYTITSTTCICNRTTCCPIWK